MADICNCMFIQLEMYSAWRTPYSEHHTVYSTMSSKYNPHVMTQRNMPELQLRSRC